MTKLIIEEIFNSVKCNVNCGSFNPHFVDTVKSLMINWNIFEFNIYLHIFVIFLLIMPRIDIDRDTLSTIESHSIFFFRKLGVSPSEFKKLLKQNENCTVLFVYSVCLIALCLFDVSVSKMDHVLTKFSMKEIFIVNNIISLFIKLPTCQC